MSGPVGGGGAEVLLDAGDSGTAARFLAATCAAIPGRFRLDGSPRMRKRPMSELIGALRSAGARIRCLGAEGFLPLSIDGDSLRPGRIGVDASRSSQFLSALLLAAVAVEGGLTVEGSGPIVSAPYVDATVEALEAFGHTVRRESGGIAVSRGAEGPARYEVPGDYSSAVPLLASVGASRGRVLVLGLPASSSAADARALPVLSRMGILVEPEGGGLAASFSGGSLRPVEVDATDFPDSVPVLAALAAMAGGESRITGIAHLRWKESDRIGSVEGLLRAAGGSARAGAGELAVTGGLAPGAALLLPTFDDHRLAMAAALIAIGRGGYLVENPDCVGKSYPAFFRDLSSLFRP